MKKVRFDGNKEINSVEDDTSTSATHNGKDVMVNGKTEVNGVNNGSDSKNDVVGNKIVMFRFLERILKKLF